MWVDYDENMKSLAKPPLRDMSESSFYQWRLSSISIHSTFTTIWHCLFYSDHPKLPFKYIREPFIPRLSVALWTNQTFHLCGLIICVCSIEFDKFFDSLIVNFLYFLIKMFKHGGKSESARKTLVIRSLVLIKLL